MSAITDWAAREQADLSAISSKLDDLATGVANLNAQIVGLQNSPGTLSASDQAALDSIEAASSTLLKKVEDISVTPLQPVQPIPPPGS